MAQQQPQNDQQNPANQQEVESKPTFNLQRVYVKDMSLEMPHAPQIFLEQETPSVNVDINVGATRLAENIRSEEHTSELQSRGHLVCRLLLEKKKTTIQNSTLRLH